MTDKARVSSVVIAGWNVECLMLPSGELGMNGIQGMTALNGGKLDLPQNAARDLKRLVGNSYKGFRVSSELNKKDVLFVTLPEFHMAIVNSAVKGNAVAYEMLERLTTASLTSIVSHAFGVKYEQEAVVAYTASRDEHRREFHKRLTAWFKLDGANGRDYARLVNRFKLMADLPLKPVDEYNVEELSRLNSAETAYHTLRKYGLSHDQASKNV